MGSTAVRRYLRDATVSVAAATARTAFMRQNLDDILKSVAPHFCSTPSSVDADTIKNVLRRELHDPLQGMRVSLLDELADVVRREMGSTSSSTKSPLLMDSSSSEEADEDDGSSGTSLDDNAKCVLQLAGRDEISSKWHGAGKRHLVSAGPPVLDPAEWTTACGWRFGRSGHALPPCDGHPPCGRCFKSKGAGNWGRA